MATERKQAGAGKSATSDTLVIALEVLRRLPRTGTALDAPNLQKQLAAVGLERDLRSIQRLLQTLADHFDIERDERVKPYGYRWKKNSGGFSAFGLTPEQALLLRLAQQHMAEQLPAAVMASMDSMFHGARVLLDTEATNAAQLARQWQHKVAAVPAQPKFVPPSIQPGVLDVVSEALYGNRYLDIQYRNAEGKRTQGRVMPLALVQQTPFLYLVVQFEGHINQRHLALHRMESAEGVDLRFKPPADFSLDRYLEGERFGYGSRERVRLSFEISKKVGPAFIEARLSEDQTVDDLGTHWRIQATVMNTLWLNKWLRGHGEQVRHIKMVPLANQL